MVQNMELGCILTNDSTVGYAKEYITEQFLTVVETYRVSVFRKWNSFMVVVRAGTVQFYLKHIHTYLYLSSLMILFVCKDAFLIH